MTTRRATPLIPLVLVAAALLPAPAHAAGGQSCNGRVATIVGKTGEHLVGTAGPDVIATDGATRVDALGGDDIVCIVQTGTDRVVVDLGPGDDTVAYTSYYGEGSYRLVGGGGRNQLVVRGIGVYSHLVVDLAAGTITTDDTEDGGATMRGSTTETGIRDVDAARFTSTILRGNRLANTLLASSGTSYDVVLDGRAGADRLVNQTQHPQHSHLYGGAGNDTLIGTNFGPDHLVGGPGRDHGNGRGGADTCMSIEVRVSC